MERMEIEELKDYYKARVEPYGKSMNEILEECAKETKAYKQLEEENKKLKSDLEECECSMHFENDEVGYRKRECKNLKAELSKYKKQYQHSMGFMEEDTLQELKDIGEL